MHHWTDSKIRVHAFYCMLSISLLQYVHRQKYFRCGAWTYIAALDVHHARILLGDHRPTLRMEVHTPPRQAFAHLADLSPKNTLVNF